jgi:hypothetical protein
VPAMSTLRLRSDLIADFRVYVDLSTVFTTPA